ncbi:MAG: hypothetical protein HQL99_01085 [Magnetococcales bacterium]|nr:hypothetical protein [Magnetococcales bacterium]
MITCEERNVLKGLEGLEIESVVLKERESPVPFRSLEFHFGNGTYLEVYESGNGMRVAGIRNSESIL